MKFASSFSILASAVLASVHFTSAAPISMALSSRAGTSIKSTSVSTGKPLIDERDATATRALSAVSIKIFDGRCLTIDPSSSDFVEEGTIFRERTAVTFEKCDQENKGQKFDVITKGVHNDKPGNALIVSAVTQTCLTSDRRHDFGDKPPAFDEVFMALCGANDEIASPFQLFTNGRDGNLDQSILGKPVQITPLILEEGDLTLVADVTDRLGFTGDRVQESLQDEERLFTFVQ